MYQIRFAPGLIGKNISYSLSPKIHNRSLELLNLSLPKYEIFSFEEPSNISIFLEQSWKNKSIYGFNVTQPYKNYVASLVGVSNPINTLYRDPSKSFWAATSTDPLGFIKSILNQGISLGEFDAFVFLGAGGAVQSVVEHLIHKSPFSKIPILVVGKSKRPWIQNLENENLIHYIPWIQDELIAWLKEYSNLKSILLVQGTSVDLHNSHVLLNFLERVDWSNRLKLYFDLSYSGENKLAQRFQESGYFVMNGLSMLIFQALESQKFWWGYSSKFQDIFSFLQNK